MNYQQVGAGPMRVLVVTPRESSLGHQVVEVAMGLHLARHFGVPVCFRLPQRVANSAVFKLECDEVPVLQGWRAALARGLAQRADQRTVRALETMRAAAARDGRKFKPGPPDFHGLDFRECYAHHRLTVRLRKRPAVSAAAAARTLGIGAADRIVTVHVRESGFKAAEGGDSAADAIRNARIDTYLPAFDLLTKRGYTVVRIGDATMTPVKHAGVVDLATSPYRTDALEMYCLFRAHLQIAGDAGPYCVSYLSHTPCLALNVTNIVGAFPLRSHDRYILKHVRDTIRGRQLSLEEMVTAEYFETRKDLDRYVFTDNTSEEIRDAVAEMLDVIEGQIETAPEQFTFREMTNALCQSEPVSRRRVRKGEPARQLLGEGLPSRAFAARFLTQAQGN
jgi:putative glycosyltransferase (TIGR04372 family)